MYNRFRCEKANSYLREALCMLEEARNHFDNADKDRVDAAIYDLTAAELHLRATLRRAREGIPVDIDDDEGAKTFYPSSYLTPQLKQLRKRD